MKTNKTPDPDGYTIEFYKTFQRELCPILEKPFNYFSQVKSHSGNMENCQNNINSKARKGCPKTTIV